MSYESPPAAIPRARRGYRLLLPIWAWIILLAVGAIALLQAGVLTEDPGKANAISMSVGSISTLLLIAWFVLFSGFPGRVRWLGLLGIVIVLGIAAALVRIQYFTGSMALRFAWRFASRSADRLSTAVPEANVVDLATTTPLDYPQFLGPQRDGNVPGVKLAADWEKAPPELLWKQPIGDGWAGVAIVNGFAVTLEQRGPQEWVSCYDVKTGKLHWANSIEARHEALPGGIGPRSTPTIHQGLVYAMGGTGRLRCLDGSSGKTLWEKDLLKEFSISARDESESVRWGRSASPLIVGDKVIVPAGGIKTGSPVSLVAYHVKTGDKIWQGGQRTPAYASPTLATIGGVQQVLIVSEDFVSGLDAASGKVLWEHPWPGSSSGDANVSNAFQVGPDQVFVSKGYGTGATLLKVAQQAGNWTVTPVWQSGQVLRTKFSNVLIRDGYAYGLSDTMLECVDLATGKRRWKGGRYGYGQNLRVGDHLLILSEEGELVLVEMSPERANNVLGRAQAIEGMTWNPFAVSGPYVVVRNGQEAACYKLPLAP